MRWLGGITDLMDEFEQASGVGDGQGGLACRSQRGSREWERLSDRTRTKREEVEAQRRSDWPGVHRRGWQIWDPTEVAWLQSPSSSPCTRLPPVRVEVDGPQKGQLWAGRGLQNLILPDSPPQSPCWLQQGTGDRTAIRQLFCSLVMPRRRLHSNIKGIMENPK